MKQYFCYIFEKLLVALLLLLQFSSSKLPKKPSNNKMNSPKTEIVQILNINSALIKTFGKYSGKILIFCLRDLIFVHER